MNKLYWLALFVAWLSFLVCGDDDDDPDDPPIPDDPGPDEDDDPEGDCWSYHQCYDSQWGYCLLRAGHAGDHFCTKCNSSF